MALGCFELRCSDCSWQFNDEGRVRGLLLNPQIQLAALKPGHALIKKTSKKNSLVGGF